MKKEINLWEKSRPKMSDYRKVLYGKSFREKGKDFENKVKGDLKKKGFKVSKSHNIHYDILAEKGSKKYAVECKLTNSSFSQAEVEYSHKVKKEGLVYKTAIRSKTGRIIYKNLTN